MTIHISGKENDIRLESRILEERIQRAVAEGASDLNIEALGQHGIGGRLWKSKESPIRVTVTGSAGQRLGSMGFPGTFIDLHGSASDDVAWLNAGAEIIIRGNASNGTCNAMAQGRVMVAGSIGARGMTMTKQNPRFEPPELWVLDCVGDYFAEFMAGGTAVICGLHSMDRKNVLSYRPCVGMVSGAIYFRGNQESFSEADAKLVDIDDTKWAWLSAGLRTFVDRIGRPELYQTLANRSEWRLIEAKSPMEKVARKRRSMQEFRSQVWDRELGLGGLVGDLTAVDRSPIPLIVTGDLRRNVPVWENCKYTPPCQASCPTGIPVQQRWKLIREGRLTEAVDLSLEYTPFPATVCGYLCPNLCMEGCTRGIGNLLPVDAQILGRAGLEAHMPELPELSGQKVAVIGGGPAGISVAWQLRRLGHEATIYDRDEVLGGKVASAIPDSRIPGEILEAELKRVREIIPHVSLDKKLSGTDFDELKKEFRYIVLATGASRPRTLPVPGGERLVPALDFLQGAKAETQTVGKRVVIIGAGNVGCDVASEAARLGAEEITLIDIQKPAAFGKEREHAEAVGARFKYPCFTKEITAEGVLLTSGEVVPADTVVVSIGDQPELEAFPDTLARERGFITVNDIYQTTDPRFFAIGDLVRPGLLTDAIGTGRKAAVAIDTLLRGKRPETEPGELSDAAQLKLETRDLDFGNSETIDYTRMTLEYFDPRLNSFDSLEQCAGECSSCGVCRDCGLCETVCPQGAISRRQLEGEDFEMVCDPSQCIGCGFCAQACPCGIWTLVKNTTPLE